jgi:hypothetical protein
MKFDAHKLGLAGALASAVFYVVGTALMQFWPERTIEMSAALFHLSSFGPLLPYVNLSPQVFVSGLVQTTVYSYIYFYIFGYAFNRVQKY